MFSQNTDVLGKYAIMEAWWRIVSTVEIESEIKARAQEKEKKSTHNLTDIRVCRFSHDHIQA